MADVFHALDDETRRLVLDELAERDGRTLFEICAVLTTRHGLGLTRQAISQHLGVLESAGLVARRDEGRFHFYAARREDLGSLGLWLEQMWDEALAHLKHHAESEESSTRNRRRVRAQRRKRSP